MAIINDDHLSAISDVVRSDLTSAADLNHAWALSFSAGGDARVTAASACARWFETPLGAMLAVADDKELCMLEFHDRRGLAGELKQLFGKTKTLLKPGMTAPLKLLEKELALYFQGKLTHFTTPIVTKGTAFQRAAWSSLTEIPYGETRSYQEQAIAVGNKKAHRAVANANARNKIAVVIPCHRIIKNDGSLGGYGGNVERKKWLLDLERRTP